MGDLEVQSTRQHAEVLSGKSGACEALLEQNEQETNNVESSPSFIGYRYISAVPCVTRQSPPSLRRRGDWWRGAHRHHPGSTLDQGQSSAAVVFEWIKFNALSNSQLAVPGHPHSLDTILAPSLFYSYGITNDLMLTLRLPYVRRTNIREGHVHGGEPEVEQLGNSAGVGDLSVLGQYCFFNNRATQTEAALLLGIKVPTGRTNVNTAEGSPSRRSSSRGRALGMVFSVWRSPSVLAPGRSYVLATEGAQDTDLGDRFHYNAAVSYRILGGLIGPGRPMYAGALPEPMCHSGPKGQRHKNTHEEMPTPGGPALDLVLGLNGEWQARQEIAGVKDPNSGRA